MTDQAALMAEAYRRGLLTPERRALYEEAMRRGLVEQDDRSLGQRFIDNVVDGFNRNPIMSGYRRGVEQSTRIAQGEDPIAVSGEGGILSRFDPFRAYGAIVGSTANLIDPVEGLAATQGYVAREDRRRESYAARAAEDPIENPLDFAAYLGGQLVGAATDPVNLISPGRTIVARAGAAGAINAAGDVYTQGADVGAGLQDRFDPIQTASAAVLGVVLSAAPDVVRETPRWVRDAYTRPVRAPEPEPIIPTVAETVADAADTLTPDPTPEFRTRPLRREGFLADAGRVLDDARGLPLALADLTSRAAGRLYEATVDRNFGLRRLQDRMRSAIERATGAPEQILPGDNAATIIRGAQDAYSIGQTDLLNGVHGYRSTTVESPALQDVMVAAAEVRTRAGGKAADAIQDLGDYLAARRALDEFDRFRAGKLKNKPVAEDEAVVRATMERLERENPDFTAHADRVSQYANAQMKKDLDAGFIDQATYDGLRAERDFYAPLRRVMDEGPSGKSSGGTKAGVVRKMKGSDRDVVNPIEALIQRTYSQAQRIRQNEINGAIISMAERLNKVLGQVASGPAYVAKPENRFTVHHGSRLKDLSSLKPSTRGPLGPGVYLSPDSAVAGRYAGEDGATYTVEIDGIFNGIGSRFHGSDLNPYAVWREQTDRLVDAAAPEARAAIRAVLESLSPDDGYRAFGDISRQLKSDAKAQDLFKRAGYRGVAGWVDGPEVVVFDAVSLKGEPAPEAPVNPFIRRVQEPKVPIRLTEARREMLARQARDPDEAQAVLDDLFDEDPAIWFRGELPEGKPIIYHWRNGKREAWELTDPVWGEMAYRAMTQLTQPQADVLGNMLSGVTAFVARTVTKSPDFMAANFVRDQLSAWILSPGDFVPFYSGARGIADEMTGADSGRLYSLGAGIAVGEAGASIPAATRGKNALALIARRGRGALGVPRYAKDFSGMGAAVQDLWRFPELTEVGTRRELFNLAFRRARKEGLSDYHALTEAHLKARDYIDFGRRGSGVHGAAKAIMFLNPWIQGLDKLVRTAVTDPASAVGRAYQTGGREAALKAILMPLIRRKTGVALRREDEAALRQAVHTWTAMSVIGAMGYTLSALFHDNEDYQNAGEEVRATHWVVPMGNGIVWRIPKPFELSFPSQIAERLAEMQHGDQLAGERMTRGLVSTFAPPTGVPLVDWAVAMQTDVDPRTGRPLTPYGMDDLPPELQYEWWSSTFARNLGRDIDMSPARIDYTIRHFGGAFGSYLLSASDAMDPDRQDGQWVDLPVARRFFSPAYRGSQDKRDFYERVGATTSRLNRALNAVDAYEAMGDMPRLNQTLADLAEPERLYIFSQRGEAATDRLNPIARARSFARRAGDIIGELNGAPVGADGVALPEMSRTERAMVRDAVEQLVVAEMGNAMIATSQPGYSQRNLRERDALWQELETLNPVVAAELERRLRIGREQAYSYEAVMELWPEVERRLRAEGSAANLDDLARQAAARSGRGRRIADIEEDPMNLTLSGAF